MTGESAYTLERRIGVALALPEPAPLPEAFADNSPSAIEVEQADPLKLARIHAAWADLYARALEPNLFLEPGFALPLFQHVSYPERPDVLLVWECAGEVRGATLEASRHRRLLGLFPLRMKTGVPGLARNAVHEQTGLGTPLVDRDAPARVLEAVLAWLATKGRAALALDTLRRDGPLCRELRRLAATTGRPFEILETHARAVLRAGTTGPTAFGAGSAKSRKERKRQFRRLSEAGARKYTSVREPAAVAAAVERFLTLEAASWKGLRGTALLSEPARATFVRTMARLMAHEGKCRVDAIEIDGRPVAMGVILTSGRGSAFWKTAFDKTYAALSPGVQFAMELSQVQQADPSVDETDSCAIANHPMIDRLWSDRLDIADVVIGTRSGQDVRFTTCRRLDVLRRGLRRTLKSGLHAWRGRGVTRAD